MSTQSVPRIGPSCIPPEGANSGSEGAAESWMLAVIKRHVGRKWSLVRPPWRSEASWTDVRRGRLQLQARDVEWIFRRIRPEAQRAQAEVTERLLALRRERRQGERRRLA